MKGAVRRMSRRMSRRRDNLANELISFQGVALAALERLLTEVATGEAAPGVKLLVCETAAGGDWAVGDTVQPLPPASSAAAAAAAGSASKGLASAGSALSGLVSRLPLGNEARKRGWRRRRDGTVGETDYPASKFREKTREEWTVEDVLVHVILPRTADKKDKFVDTLDKKQRGEAYHGVFVCHAHGSNFRDLVGALGSYFQRTQAAPEARHVWLDVCSANHHLLAARTALQFQDKFQVMLESGLHRAMTRFPARVVFFDRWHGARPLARAWCVWELYGMITGPRAAPLEVILSPHDEAALPDMLLGDYHDVQRAFSEFDARSAQALDLAPAAPEQQQAAAAALGQQHKPKLAAGSELDRNSDAALLHAILNDLKGGYAAVNGAVLGAIRVALLDKVQHAVKKRVGMLGVDSPEAADLQVATGLLMSEEQCFEEALTLLRAALETRRAKFGPDDLRVAHVLGHLANALADQGKPNEAFKAVACYEEELAISRAALPQNHPAVATVLNNLACLLEDLQRTDEALRCFLEALEIRRQQPGTGQPEEEAVVLVNIGSLYHSLGNFDEALAYTSAALAIYRKLNASHPQIPELLSNMAVIHHSKGDMAGAMQQLRDAEAAAEDDVARVDIQLLMANLLDADGSLDAALALYESALSALVEQHGPRHVQCAAVLNYVGTTLHAMGRFAEALPRYDEALSVRREVLGELHPDTAQVLFNRAQSLQALGRLGAAVESSRAAFEVYRRTCGGSHPDTVDSREQLAALKAELGRAPANAQGARRGKQAPARPEEEEDDSSDLPPLPTSGPPRSTAESAAASSSTASPARAPPLGASGRAVSRRMQRAVSTRMRITVNADGS